MLCVIGIYRIDLDTYGGTKYITIENAFKCCCILHNMNSITIVVIINRVLVGKM